MCVFLCGFISTESEKTFILLSILLWKETLSEAFAKHDLRPENPVQLLMKICLLMVSFNEEARLAYICSAVQTLPDMAANKN